MAEIILVAKRHLVTAHNLIACRYNRRATACWRMIRVRLSRQREWSGRRDLNRAPSSAQPWNLPRRLSLGGQPPHAFAALRSPREGGTPPSQPPCSVCTKSSLEARKLSAPREPK